MLGEKLLEKDKSFCTSFNFGPESHDVASVDEMVALSKQSWPQVDAKFTVDPDQKHEAGLLKLDITKAREQLKWKPVWQSSQATAMTINWYKDFYKNKKISTQQNLEEFIALL